LNRISQLQLENNELKYEISHLKSLSETPPSCLSKKVYLDYFQLYSYKQRGLRLLSQSLFSDWRGDPRFVAMISEMLKNFNKSKLPNTIPSDQLFRQYMDSQPQIRGQEIEEMWDRLKRCGNEVRMHAHLNPSVYEEYFMRELDRELDLKSARKETEKRPQSSSESEISNFIFTFLNA